jgi:hypothetical protein
MFQENFVTFRADQSKTEYDFRFKLFHELMSQKVKEILLVSTPYDAWIMEEDCRLSERIVNEYRGLNLSKPPRLTWTSSAEEALALSEKGALIWSLPCHGWQTWMSLIWAGRSKKKCLICP